MTGRKFIYIEATNQGHRNKNQPCYTKLNICNVRQKYTSSYNVWFQVLPRSSWELSSSGLLGSEQL